MPPARGRGAPRDGPRRRKSQPYMIHTGPGGYGCRTARGGVESASTPPSVCLRALFGAVSPVSTVACPVWSLSAEAPTSDCAQGRVARARVTATCWDITMLPSAVAPRWDELLPVLSCHRAPVAHPAHYHIGPQGHLCGLPASYFGGFGAPPRGSAGRAAVCGLMRQEGAWVRRVGRRREATSSAERQKKRRLRSRNS